MLIRYNYSRVGHRHVSQDVSSVDYIYILIQSIQKIPIFATCLTVSVAN